MHHFYIKPTNTCKILIEIHLTLQSLFTYPFLFLMFNSLKSPPILLLYIHVCPNLYLQPSSMTRTKRSATHRRPSRGSCSASRTPCRWPHVGVRPVGSVTTPSHRFQPAPLHPFHTWNHTAPKPPEKGKKAFVDRNPQTLVLPCVPLLIVCVMCVFQVNAWGTGVRFCFSQITAYVSSYLAPARSVPITCQA
jgi:hypothetical protein